MNVRLVSLLSSSFLTACAVASPDAGDDTEQGIIRGKAESGFPQVVLLHAERPSGVTRCSGTYVASRVILTAAHCARADVLPGRFFVYHGTNYAADVAALPNIPAPGQTSSWARAESWAAHPSYSASVNYPDLALVYLDRALPFAPLPLYRSALGASWVGKTGTVVGWGASAALKPDLSQVSGGGVKRSAKQTILGSPTAADFVPADPNPGIQNASIRAALLKLDGRAPSANTCAGDSGGPLIVEQSGVSYVAGVAFWTGLSCEGYAMYTRIDPFLGYFDDGFRRGGSLPLTPRLECVDTNVRGGLTAYFGYRNDNAVTVSVPHDLLRNVLLYDVGRERPAAFGPGDHRWSFGVDFLPSPSLVYRLAPVGLTPTTVVANAASPRCPASQARSCARHCDAALAAACFDKSLTFEQCERECELVATSFAGCETKWNTYLECVARLPASADRWECSSGFTPFPVLPYCDAEYTSALACAGF